MTIVTTLRTGAYGSRRLKLRPLHPFVGLEATDAMNMAITAQQTVLKENSVSTFTEKTV